MIYTKNKIVQHNYFIEDEIEAGMVLTGPEVKGIVEGRAQLKTAYITIRNSEAFLIQAHISKPTNADEFSNFNETRDRKLLLHKKEILKLRASVQKDGVTLMPLKIYQPENSNKLKLLLGVCKGKKQHDKRQTIKERDAKIQTARAKKGMY